MWGQGGVLAHLNVFVCGTWCEPDIVNQNNDETRLSSEIIVGNTEESHQGTMQNVGDTSEVQRLCRTDPYDEMPTLLPPQSLCDKRACKRAADR